MNHILSQSHSLASQFLSELRDTEIQKDRSRFRKNLERLGEIFAYEISKKLEWKNAETTTPLGIAGTAALVEQPVIATILRAGLPLHQGLLNFFDHADAAFISAYRKPKKDGSFNIKVEYTSSPALDNKVLIIADPMLATGNSIVLACKELMELGKIKTIHIVSVIASAEGVAFVNRQLPKAHLWLGAVDEEMTSQYFIVPGLGDAGDLAFGEKIVN